ncbi:MAG TPA: F0F1 ATP synthase subunit B [Mycobacteriales bacterium]|nr:F0F1 ATP synthase subunit B [Mycobacteriales bacterium]
MSIVHVLADTTPPATEKTNNFLIPNGTFFFELILFVIILVIIWKKIYPRLAKVLEDRQALIDRQIAESAEAKDRLEKAESEYREALAEAKKEAAKIREDAAADKARIVEEARGQAQQQVDDMLRRAEDRIATEREQAIRALRSEVGTLAVSLAERVVRVSLEDDAKQRQVVDAFLAALESDTARESEPASG